MTNGKRPPRTDRLSEDALAGLVMRHTIVGVVKTVPSNGWNDGMKSAGDMRGMQISGRIRLEANDPVFHPRREARISAIDPNPPHGRLPRHARGTVVAIERDYPVCVFEPV